MIKRNATAVWNGSGKEGAGHLTTASTVLNETQYSFNTRFADGVGTNPEELIAAAHAGCFAMKLSFDLNAAGFTADEINAKATVVLDPSKGEVTESNLVVTAKVPGLSAEQFAEIAAGAKANCPISKLLNAAISLDATLA
ncbi:OsmC family protein [Siphonobacter aquaeclarae]|jgi:osmotically inducible protein OsmC|uniref:Osmotically inducible protein OsmC n=1 Tax=Siphonobacter aquaeclarae TaxID=563176 RepID=A0A1G9T498_9BACT|nr:OsmC family protein [Siphonobacter aquaeclarae]SDM42539.1 osmotically inducible protein OsmC [Siphonobacter aquaeclarae]